MVRPLTVAVLCALSGVAAASQVSRPCGMYPAAVGPSLPLEKSDVAVTVRGPIVEVVVTQTFKNPGDHATEATYVFPLPADAAVSAMSMTLGTRSIHAAIARRKDAVDRYEAAVSAGVGAALLEEERPDIFTQTISAIPAHGEVSVTLRFDTTARRWGTGWELALPLVVAPRYTPGTASGRPTTGTGRAPDTDRAPDASRITPPGAPGAGGATHVSVHFADEPADVASPTHELTGTGADYAYADPKSDHDAILRWHTRTSSAGWTEIDAGGGFAAAVVTAPPAAATHGLARAILVIDRAATTRGDADLVAHPFVRALLRAMTAADRVRVIGSDTVAWGPGAEALRIIERDWTLPAGPFDLTRVIAAARGDHAPIILVTDGLVADDRAAILEAAKLGVPIHVIGVGPAPARGALTALAAASGGTVRFAIPGDDPDALAHDVLADVALGPAPISVAWGALAVTDVTPAVLPRLGAGQAVLVLGRVKAPPEARANGRAHGDLFAIEPLQPRAPERTVPGETTPLGPLGRRWARSKLDDLLARGDGAAATAHALANGLVSPDTAMVAIGTETIVSGGVQHSVAIPVSVPAGMEWQRVREQTVVGIRGEVATTEEPDAKKVFDAGALAPPPPAPPPVANPVHKTVKEDIAAADDEDDDNADKVTRHTKPVTHAKPVKDAKHVKDVKTGKKPKPAHEHPYPATSVVPRPNEGPAPVAQPAEPPPAADTATGGEVIHVDGTAPTIDPTSTQQGVTIDQEYTKNVPVGRTFGAELGTEEMVEVAGATSFAYERRTRYSLSLGGGVVFGDGATHPLGALGARIDHLFGRVFFGGDAALWLAGEHVQGRILLDVGAPSFLGIRWLELGGGIGAHLGADSGVGADLRLRVTRPWHPRFGGSLRYDAAFLPGPSAVEHALTLGIDVAF
ncbi:MAG TPA: VIT domain-containing protein [Kofleriaceae bacterium]|jgi:Ca-activated chloride channel family protein